MASKLDAPDVLPGQSVPLTIHINTFDAYKPSYWEMVRVVTDAGDLVLTIRGSLPLPQSVLFRPQVVYLESIPDLAVVERLIMVRVPKHLCREFSASDIHLTGCTAVKAELIEEARSELFREFTIRLTVPADRLDMAVGSLQLDTGGGLVEVRIRNSPG